MANGANGDGKLLRRNSRARRNHEKCGGATSSEALDIFTARNGL